MKKGLSIVLAFLFFLGFYALAFSEEKMAEKKGKEMMQGSTNGKEMMGMMDKGKMMGMCPMMMGKSLVATTDGGAIVLIGNKLQKYDKDLVLQKEVEIKMDMEGMQKMMMGKCPMKSEKKEAVEKTEPELEQGGGKR